MRAVSRRRRECTAFNRENVLSCQWIETAMSHRRGVMILTKTLLRRPHASVERYYVSRRILGSRTHGHVCLLSRSLIRTIYSC